MSARSKRQHPLRLGTRTSRLARWQSARIVSLLTETWPNLKCEIRPFETKGDKNIDRPLPEIGGKGLFTAELEAALLAGDIDIAVHSLKDLPVQNPPGLTIGAIPRRGDVGDALVARNGETLSTLSPGAVVGTSSLRRQAQLLAVRPDLRVRSIRGNVETRVRKVHEGHYDAAVLATAGLKRLQLEEEASAWLPLDIMLPAPGQGALAVQCRAADHETLALLQAIDHPATRRETTTERHFLEALGGGCSAPIAAYARSQGNHRLQMEALIAAPSGGSVIRVSGSGADPYELATDLAADARSRGAEDILASITAADSPSSDSPLAGRRIVITRPRSQASEFASQLRDLGAVPIRFPTIRIAPIDDTTSLDTAIRDLENYDWIIFTSVNGVDVFHQRLEAMHVDVDQLNGVRVAAIGPATGSALSEMGVMPDFIPDEYVAERIAEGLGDVEGQKILLPRAEQARAALSELLSARGADVNEIATYRTVRADPEDEARAHLSTAGVITFTSSSTVRNFVSLVGGSQEASRLASRAVVACIGPITAATAAELGMEPQIVAEEYTIDGLIAALLAYFQ